MTPTRAILLVLIVLFSILGLIMAVRVSDLGSGDGVGFFEKGKKINCRVNVNIDRVTSSDIEGVDCNVVDDCSSWMGFFGLPFVDLKKEVTVYLKYDGKVKDSTGLSAILGIGSQAVDLNACLPQSASQVLIEVKDKNGVVEDSRVVNI